MSTRLTISNLFLLSLFSLFSVAASASADPKSQTASDEVISDDRGRGWVELPRFSNPGFVFSRSRKPDLDSANFTYGFSSKNQDEKIINQGGNSYQLMSAWKGMAKAVIDTRAAMRGETLKDLLISTNSKTKSEGAKPENLSAPRFSGFKLLKENCFEILYVEPVNTTKKGTMGKFLSSNKNRGENAYNQVFIRGSPNNLKHQTHWSNYKQSGARKQVNDDWKLMMLVLHEFDLICLSETNLEVQTHSLFPNSGKYIKRIVERPMAEIVAEAPEAKNDAYKKHLTRHLSTITTNFLWIPRFMRYQMITEVDSKSTTACLEWRKKKPSDWGHRESDHDKSDPPSQNLDYSTAVFLKKAADQVKNNKELKPIDGSRDSAIPECDLPCLLTDDCLGYEVRKEGVSFQCVFFGKPDKKLLGNNNTKTKTKNPFPKNGGEAISCHFRTIYIEPPEEGESAAEEGDKDAAGEKDAEGDKDKGDAEGGASLGVKSEDEEMGGNGTGTEQDLNGTLQDGDSAGGFDELMGGMPFGPGGADSLDPNSIFGVNDSAFNKDMDGSDGSTTPGNFNPNDLDSEGKSVNGNGNDSQIPEGNNNTADDSKEKEDDDEEKEEEEKEEEDADSAVNETLEELPDTPPGGSDAAGGPDPNQLANLSNNTALADASALAEGGSDDSKTADVNTPGEDELNKKSKKSDDSQREKKKKEKKSSDDNTDSGAKGSDPAGDTDKKSQGGAGSLILIGGVILCVILTLVLAGCFLLSTRGDEEDAEGDNEAGPDETDEDYPINDSDDPAAQQAKQENVLSHVPGSSKFPHQGGEDGVEELSDDVNINPNKQEDNWYMNSRGEWVEAWGGETGLASKLIGNQNATILSEIPGIHESDEELDEEDAKFDRELLANEDNKFGSEQSEDFKPARMNSANMQFSVGGGDPNGGGNALGSRGGSGTRGGSKAGGSRGGGSGAGSQSSLNLSLGIGSSLTPESNTNDDLQLPGSEANRGSSRPSGSGVRGSSGAAGSRGSGSERQGSGAGEE